MFDFHNILKETLELQRGNETADKERNTTIKPKRVNFCFIQLLSKLFHTTAFFLFEICSINSVR